MPYTERNFEEHIEEFLKSKNFNSYKSEEFYNKKFCVIPKDLFSFLEKTYMEPELIEELSSWLPFIPVALLSSLVAPIAILFPLSEEEIFHPNKSSESVLDAFIYACCVHTTPLNVNTYTAPLSIDELSD